jgi:hypothetical protein
LTVAAALFLSLAIPVAAAQVHAPAFAYPSSK